MADTLRKREVKPPKRFVADLSSHRSQVGAKRKAAKPDKTPYEIELIDIDKAQDKVKIHYKGYGSEFDEWRSCVELIDYRFVWRSCVYRVRIPLKTDTTHFTIVCTER